MAAGSGGPRRLLRWRQNTGPPAGEAERRFDVDREVTARSLRTALALDGKLGEGAYEEFFEHVLPPARTA
ncbi:hypothetical protein [Streptomyces albicerus]|uniref:hypothetical protein n=1 Tax=Streptomyces albicerus TaxID=2569859 RepID=UPI00124B2E5C|nr:hypothetical protein [Streptomyces albicerus]